MLKEIEQRKSELRALCRRFGVKRLDLFGSAAGAGDSSGINDLDFLVDFGDLPPAIYANAYFTFRAALEQLFAKPVDLVTNGSLRNPYFKQRLEQTRSLLYAA